MSIEGHRQISEKHPANRCGAHFPLRELDETIGREGLQSSQGVSEGRVEVDSELLLDLALDDDAVAEQIADDGPAQPIVPGKMKTPEGRRPFSSDRVPVSGKLPAILDV